jgi:serine/threonine protein kinase
VIRSLAALHTLGFAHRDLKPENILVSPDKGVMLVDFGFTKNVVDGQQSISGIVKGTPAYMAPELWTGGCAVDPMRCDVFAAGKIVRDILSKDIFPNFTAQCISDDPSQRPASGSEMLALWQDSAPHIGQPDWRRMASALSSERLSTKLSDAAGVLLCGGREDEAYWLLVEGIEENPKNSEAVSLMNSFPKYVQHKRLKRRIGSAAVATACLFLLVAAFAAGRHSRDWTSPSFAASSSSVPHNGRMSSLASIMRPSDVLTAPSPSALFRCDSSVNGTFCGILCLSGHPTGGKLFVNGEAMNRITSYSSGIALSPGKHVLAWIDEHGKIAWREKITLLPFEIKVLAVASNQRN